jgi:hypothetical protein
MNDNNLLEKKEGKTLVHEKYTRENYPNGV